MAELPPVSSVLGPVVKKLPPVSSVLGPVQGSDSQANTGDLADWYFTKTKAGRIMSAMGHGAENGWGAVPWTLPKETEDELRKANIYNDYANSRTSFIKTANEAFMRPAINGLLAVAKPISGLIGGAVGGIQQFGREEENTATELYPKFPITATVHGMIGELVGSSPERIPEAKMIPWDFTKARAEGIIGEIKGKDPTPEQLTARYKAIGDLHEKDTAVPDIDKVAREFNPQAFEAYETLQMQHTGLLENLKSTIEARASDPRVVAANQEIETILSKVKGLEENLTKKAAERLEEIRGDLKVFMTTDTPGMIQAKQYLLDNFRGKENKVAEGSIRIYRGEGGDFMGSVKGGGWFTTDIEKARRYAKNDNELKYIDVPYDKEHMQYFARGHGGADEYFIQASGLEALKNKGITPNTFSKFSKGMDYWSKKIDAAKKGARAYIGPKNPPRDVELPPAWLQELQDVTKVLDEGEADPLKWLNDLMEGTTEWKTKLRGPVDNIQRTPEEWIAALKKGEIDYKPPVNKTEKDFSPDPLAESRFGPLKNPFPEPTEPVQTPPGAPLPTGPKTAKPAAGASKAPSEALSEGGVQPSPIPVETPAVENLVKTPDKPPKPSDHYINKEGKVNIDHIIDEEDLKNFFDDFYNRNKELLDLRRGKLSDADRRKIVELTGLRDSDVNLERLNDIYINNEHQLSTMVDGLGEALKAQLDLITELAEAGDLIALAAAEQKLLSLTELVLAAKAEAGRVMRVFRKFDPKEANVFEQAGQLSEYLQTNTGKTTSQLKAEMARIKKLKTPRKVAGFIQDMAKPSAGDMIQEIFINWLISGPISQGYNISSNAAFLFLDAVPESIVASGIGKVHEVIAGKPIERVRLGETQEALYAMLYGQRAGIKAALDALVEGQVAPLVGEQRIAATGKAVKQSADGPHLLVERTKAVPGWLGTGVRLPSRTMAVGDSYSRTITYTVERARLIYRQARNEGLTGTKLRQRISVLESHTPLELTKAARDKANEITLMGKPGDWTRRFQGLISAHAYWPGLGIWQPAKILVPFVGAISKLNQLAVIDRTPLGLAFQSTQNNLKGINGTVAQHQAIAKMTVGTAILSATASYYLDGSVTAGPSRDHNEAIVDSMIDGMPYSAKVGDMSYQLGRMGVPGLQIMMGAIFAEASKSLYDTYYSSDDPSTRLAGKTKEDEYKKATFQLIMSLGETFINTGMLSGLADSYKAIDEPERYGDTWGRNFVSTLTVPYSVGSSQVTGLVDPYQREVYSVLDSIKSKVPVQSESLEPRIDIFGNKVPNREYYGVYAQHISNDPAWQLLKDSGYFPSKVSKTIDGIELTPVQYREYAALSGMYFHNEGLVDFINNPKFDSLSKQAKYDFIQNAVQQSRERAAADIKLKYSGENTPDKENILKQVNELNKAYKELSGEMK